MTIIWCMVPEIWSVTDRIFCHSETLFVLLPPYRPRKSKFWKNKKNSYRYYHFTQAYHKWQSYDVWFLRHKAWQTELLVILDHFLPFCLPLTTQKIKILKKIKKTPGDIIILHMCILNDNNMIYGSWNTKCDGQNSLSFFGQFFALVPSPLPP